MIPYLRQLYRTSKEEWESSREGREAEEEERARQEEPEEIPDEGKPLISGNSPKRSVRTLLRQNASVTQFLLFALGMAVGLMFMGFLIMPAQMSVLQRERSDLAGGLPYGGAEFRRRQSDRSAKAAGVAGRKLWSAAERVYSVSE